MIVSSVVADDATQADGRRWITERHTDHLGLIYEFRYLAEAAADAAAALAARVAIVNAGLTAAEIAANIAAVLANGSLADTNLNYSNAAQNFAGLRLAYAGMTRR